MWTIFISNKMALRATQVAKTSVFCVKSFQAEWFLDSGDYNLPPRLCNSTPLDYFLGGYVKDKVYVDALQLIQELKEKNRAVM